MPPALNNYEFAFGDSGTVLNTDGMGLPFLDVTSISGLDAAPLRTTTDEHEGMDGTYIDTPFMSSRTVVITGNLYTDPSSPEALLKSLRRDYQSNAVRPFYYQLPGQGLQFVNGQGGGCVYDVDQNRRIGMTPLQLMILCGDPYIYDYPASVSSISVPTIVAVGTGFNMAFNVGFGGSIPTNSATVNNNGTHDAYPVITLTGACTNPAFTDAFGTNMNFGITLAATDQLVIDCHKKTVILNGQVSRRSALSGLNWFVVPAGESNTFFFGAAAGTATAIISVNSTYY